MDAYLAKTVSKAALVALVAPWVKTGSDTGGDGAVPSESVPDTPPLLVPSSAALEMDEAVAGDRLTGGAAPWGPRRRPDANDHRRPQPAIGLAGSPEGDGANGEVPAVSRS